MVRGDVLRGMDQQAANQVGPAANSTEGDAGRTIAISTQI